MGKRRDGRQYPGSKTAQRIADTADKRPEDDSRGSLAVILIIDLIF
jgi:hypothetical protein